MKRTSFQITIVLLIQLASAGCQKTYVVSKSQEVLYQAEYLKNSDPHSLHGFFIDAKGNVLSYRSPEKWNFPKEDQTIGKNDLLENLSATRMGSKKIPAHELQKYINYIDNFAASKVTLPKIHSVDGGTLFFYCYQYSEGAEEYKRTIIKTEGHINCENLNFFSKKVVSWLTEIENEEAR